MASGDLGLTSGDPLVFWATVLLQDGGDASPGEEGADGLSP